MNTLSAKDARKISLSSCYLNEIYDNIRSAAKNGDFSVKIGFSGIKADNIVDNFEYIIEELESKGYSVSRSIDRSCDELPICYYGSKKVRYANLRTPFVSFEIRW